MTFILRLLLGQILGSPEVKARIMAELRDAAKKTETTFDDSAVDAFEGIWSIVVPVIVGKV